MKQGVVGGPYDCLVPETQIEKYEILNTQEINRRLREQTAI